MTKRAREMFGDAILTILKQLGCERGVPAGAFEDAMAHALALAVEAAESLLATWVLWKMGRLMTSIVLQPGLLQVSG